MKYYIYAHKRKTDGTVFYIGKGSIARSKTKSSRNKYWRRTVKKYGYEIVIVKSFDDEQEAYDYEVKAIKILRWIGCKLCNIASGGEGGLSGHTLSEDHKQKLRLAHLGKKQSPEHAKKSANAKLGKKQPKSAIETTMQAKRRKVINSLGEIFDSATLAAKTMAERTGCKPSQGNISTCARGERIEAYGLAWSYNIEAKPRAPVLTRIVVNKTLGVYYKSLKLASLDMGVASQSISSAARNGTSCCSFKWSYAEDIEQ